MNLKIVPTARRRVIDISVWQPSFNGNVAKSQEISEVICRASYGASKDRLVDAHASNVLKAGLILSAYSFTTAHYYSVNGGNFERAMSVAKSQAHTFVQIAKQIGVNGLLALDVEVESGQRNALNKQQLTDLCNAYMDILAAAGYPAVLYMSTDPMINWLYIDKIKYHLWSAYYYRYGTKTSYDSDPSKGTLPNGTYGKWLQAHSSRLALWQFTSEGYASQYGIAGSGISNNSGLDKNYAYYEYSGEQPEKEGVQFMKVVDVYASITQNQSGAENRFNVQGFEKPDVTSKVLTDDSKKGLPDGRYWCNSTGVKLAGLDGYTGAEIMVNGTKMYVAIISGATEITEMPASDAYSRFLNTSNQHDGCYTEAEMLEVQQALENTENKLADAEEKIKNAQAALK